MLKACPVSGEGNSSADLVAAGKKLGASVRTVSADEQGLQMLPKPLVAFVEKDHFVAVVRADSAGVSYLCSDCGPWPGGRVNLTWQQWRTMDATSYLVATKPGSAWDKALAGIPTGTTPAPSGIKIGYTGSLADLHLGLRAHMSNLLPVLRGHVAKLDGVGNICGWYVSTLRCVIGAVCCFNASAGPGGKNSGVHQAHSSGPASGDPVNLATLEEDYQPDSDLSVYNPIGPNVSWQRSYQSLRDTSYELDDFGPNWTQNYNISISDTTLYIPVRIMAGGGATIYPHGTAVPLTNGLTWDVQLNGSTVASSSAPANWAVSFSTNGLPHFSVTVPSTATVAQSYQMRCLNGSTTYGGVFDVVAAGGTAQVQQAGTSVFNSTGTDSPGAGLTWDVVQGSNTISSSSQPNGWAGSYTGTQLSVTAPMSAVLGNYEVRVKYGSTNISAPFTVYPIHFVTAAGDRYLNLPDGSKVHFTTPSIPTSTNPKVACVVDAGYPMYIYWNYDPVFSSGTYTVVFSDRSRWVTTPATINDTYLLGKQVDRNGNAINFNYISPAYLGNNDSLLLSSITDSAGSALLQIARSATNGNITSVSDRYGRSIYYQYSTTNFMGFTLTAVSQVSQIVATGTSNPPMRYTLGYAGVYNGVPTEAHATIQLHTITVPSPTGSGTSTATINYTP